MYLPSHLCSTALLVRCIQACRKEYMFCKRQSVKTRVKTMWEKLSATKNWSIGTTHWPWQIQSQLSLDTHLGLAANSNEFRRELHWGTMKWTQWAWVEHNNLTSGLRSLYITFFECRCSNMRTIWLAKNCAVLLLNFTALRKWEKNSPPITSSMIMYKQHSSWNVVAKFTINGWGLSLEMVLSISFSERMCSTFRAQIRLSGVFYPDKKFKRIQHVPACV